MKAADLSEADVEGIKDYLASFDLFAGIEAEGQSYINLALRRFLITLSLVPPAAAPGMRLLELGGNPYFLTLLLKRFRSYDITLANYFGPAGPKGGRGIQVIRSARYGETHEFEYDHFNGETDEFPYPDHTFDIVLNCEILEHLTVDPTSYLCECQRVLKPGGALLLTTPNVLAFQNLWRLGSGRNVFDLYSGYGSYGRHNREYTPRELIELVEGCSFKLEQIRIDDIYPSHGLTHWLKRARHHWRDNLFLVARATGRPIYYYPNWLYRSMGSLRHVRRPDIVMGENDSVQLGPGWHPLERLPYPVRWTSGRAAAWLRAAAAPDIFVAEVNAFRSGTEEVELTVELPGGSWSGRLPPNAWQQIVVPAPPDLTGEVEVVLSVSPTYNPKRAGASLDDRDLGVLVKRLGFAARPDDNKTEGPGDLERGIAETQSFEFYGADFYDAGKTAAVKSGYAGYGGKDPAIAAAARIVTQFFKPSRALDVGCAKGFLVDTLRRHHVEAWGIDFSPYAIRSAPAGVRQYVAVGDCNAIEWPDNAFDLVVCMETLEHLRAENALRAVSELYRVTSDKAWVTTPSLGTNDFGPPNGWPNGKIRESALERYLGENYPDPALLEDLFLDDRGRPIHGHLIAASYRWWTTAFTRRGFIRRGDLERRMNRGEQLLSSGAWNSYVLEKPAWEAGRAPGSSPTAGHTVTLTPVDGTPGDGASVDGGDIVGAGGGPAGLLAEAQIDVAPGCYCALLELIVQDAPQNPWAEIARIEVRSHGGEWIHGLVVLRVLELTGARRIEVPFCCSAGEGLTASVYHAGNCRLRLGQVVAIQPAVQAPAAQAAPLD